MNKWEIWLAKVVFEDNPNEVKNRPVLIYNHTSAFYLSFKITSHSPRDDKEYQINNWQQCGLDKPSVIRTSKLLQLTSADFVHKIGKLSPYDIVQFSKKLK